MHQDELAIQTYTGKRFWPLTLEMGQNEVDIRDIAHALSLKCRFGGHCRQFYSVAEHSVLTAELMRQRRGNDLTLTRWALLHDASEAYVVDIPRPAKRQLGEYIKIEDAIQRAVAERFELPWPMPEDVHEVDHDLLSIELRAYMPSQPDALLPPLPVDWSVDELPIQPLFPSLAETEFLDKAKSLGIV